MKRRLPFNFILTIAGLVGGVHQPSHADDPVGNVLRSEGIVDAPIEAVWNAFTTKEGIESWMVPHAEIDLRVGGKMRTTYDPNGVIGDDSTIENTILSFDPPHMLSIKATKPPADFPMKEAIKNMWSVIYLDSVDSKRTRITVVGMGYGDDEASQTLRKHFDAGNAWTINKLQERFGKAPASQPIDISGLLPDKTHSTRRPAAGAAPATPGDSEAEFSSYLAHIAAASAALGTGQVAEVDRWLSGAPARYRNWEWRYLKAAMDKSVRTSVDQKSAVMSVAISTDGRLLAEALADGTTILRDAESWKEIRRVNASDKSLWHVAFNRDASRFATSSSDGVARIYDTSTGELVRELKHEKTQVYSASFSPDGERLATSMLSYVKMWDLKTGEEIRTLKGHVERPPVPSVTYSPDGKLLASASWDNHVIIWDAETGAELHKLGPGYGGAKYTPYNAVVFSPNGEELCACSGNKTITTWSAADGKQINQWEAHDQTIYAVAYSRDGTRIASAGADGRIRIWNSATGALEFEAMGHRDVVRSLAIGMDDQTLVSAGADQRIKRWAVKDQSPSVIKCAKGVWSSPFSPDGKRIATASSDMSVRVWDSSNGKELASFLNLPEQATSAAFSPDGKQLAAVTNDPTVLIWNLETQELIHELKGHRGGSPCVVWNSKGDRIATASYDGTIRVWDPDRGETILVIDKKEAGSYRIAFSPDDGTIASAGNDGMVHLWDANSGEEVAAMKGHSARVLAVCFSRDGELVASTGNDRTIRIWDVTSRECLHTLNGHGREVYGLTFSPDRSRLGSASYDQTVRLWDVNHGVCVAKLIDSEESAYAIEFSPDGTRLAATFVDGTVRLLDTLSAAERQSGGSVVLSAGMMGR